MVNKVKDDAEEILLHMGELASKLRLDGNRKWWPNWIFRSDHVENAAAILNSGTLLSRSRAEEQALIVKDAASPHHIHQLTASHRRYVRLYFRPRTPTQYRNEGVRPASKIWNNAHMPVPVYFLFSVMLLADDNVRFSRGRLTSTTQVGKSAKFLKSIEFSDVYHDRGVGLLGQSDERSSILYARHSEVLVRDELSLHYLKHIVCRSAAERDTLICLLSPRAKSVWLPRIHVDEGRRLLFFKMGTFIQHTHLSSTESRFVFYSNISSDMRGPFILRVEWTSDDSNLSFVEQSFFVDTRPKILKLDRELFDYTVSVKLNDDLIYVGIYDSIREKNQIF